MVCAGITTSIIIASIKDTATGSCCTLHVEGISFLLESVGAVSAGQAIITIVCHVMLRGEEISMTSYVLQIL